MKIECPDCGKKVDARGFGIHRRSHLKDHKSPQSASPIQTLIELEKQTKDAVNNLRQTREIHVNQISQIDEMLTKYDKSHPKATTH